MDEVLFYDRRRPLLQSGEYSIYVSQELNVRGQVLSVPENELRFILDTEKYRINPIDIESVYPSAGSQGDFVNILPHIALKKNTFPWERTGQSDNQNSPWLALIIFCEDELLAGSNAGISIKNVSREKWEKNQLSENFDDKANAQKKEELITIVVGNRKYFSQTLLPDLIELSHLAHIRQTGNEELSIVICNRLPTPNKRNFVHLVSVENLYTKDAIREESNNKMALVSLKSWDFFCNDHFIISTEQLQICINDIGKKDSKLGDILSTSLPKHLTKEFTESDKFWMAAGIDPATCSPGMADSILNYFRVGHLSGIIRKLRFINKDLLTASTSALVARGFSLLPYVLRNGKKIEAAYRGPLTIVSVKRNSFSTVSAADDLLSYLDDFKKVDVTYAAAWQIGRLTALSDKTLAVAICQWKRNCYRLLKANKPLNDQSSAIPPIIRRFFDDLFSGLKPIPFNYIIPDISWIPVESMLVLQIDNNWLQHFWDGVLSLGRTTAKEKEYDNILFRSFQSLSTINVAQNAFILHSKAVSGWPELGLEVKNAAGPVSILRKEKIAPAILFVTLGGIADSVSFFQKSEHVHYGADNSNFNRIKNYLTYKSAESIPEGEIAKFAKQRLQSGEKITIRMLNAV